MVRAVKVAGACGPDSPPCKNRHKDKKNDAANLEPENATHAAEGTQKAAHAAAHGTSGVAHRLPSVNRGAGCRLAGGAALVLSTRGLGACNWSRLMHLRSRGRGLRVTLQKLPGHAPGDAHSDAKGAANHARSHSVYDGSSGLWCVASRHRFPGCSQRGIGSKVERFHAATRMHYGAGSRSWRCS